MQRKSKEKHYLFTIFLNCAIYKITIKKQQSQTSHRSLNTIWCKKDLICLLGETKICTVRTLILTASDDMKL